MSKLWGLLVFLLPLASCGKPYIALNGAGVLERGEVPRAIQPPLSLIWRTKLKGPILAPPAVRGTTMFVPMSNNKIYLMNAENGLVAEFTDEINGTGAVTPALGGDTLFLSVVGQTPREWREFVAFDTRKKETIWRRKLLNGLSAPTLVDSVVYTGSENGIAYALAADSGETIWEHRVGRQVRTTPVVRDGRVYVGSDDNRIYALDADNGDELWTYRTDGTVTRAPAVSADAVYIPSYDQSLYCLDASSGELRWKFTTGGSLYCSPIVDNGKVYQGSNDRNLYCLDAFTGRELWRFQTEGIVVAPPLTLNGYVYVVSTDRHVYALDAETGLVTWKYETQDSINVAPFVVQDVLMVGSDDRHIYAFSALRN
ncbi:MAG: PQQ-like beta-propeller repeat protein [Candidatus Latescibacteria bacterium]|jgi:eukaryotic-like serine/threonine-protein kinase|nr:PQQ-like beta-propeller repeat protein [Candidatus Latescibacterota bacterium]